MRLQSRGVEASVLADTAYTDTDGRTKTRLEVQGTVSIRLQPGGGRQGSGDTATITIDGQQVAISHVGFAEHSDLIAPGRVLRIADTDYRIRAVATWRYHLELKLTLGSGR